MNQFLQFEANQTKILIYQGPAALTKPIKPGVYKGMMSDELDLFFTRFSQEVNISLISAI